MTSTTTPSDAPPHGDADDFDLDGLLTPEQRRAVQDTPLWSVARILLAFAALAVLVLWSGNRLEDARRATADYQEVVTQLEGLADRAPASTPADLPGEISLWQRLEGRGASLTLDGDRAARFQAAAGTAAEALARQATLHLASPELMTPPEYVTLAAALDDMLDRGGEIDLPSSLREQGSAQIARAVERGTRAAAQLGAEGAPLDDLVDARTMLLQMAELSDPRLRSDYAEAARRLGGRIDRLRQQNQGQETGVAGGGTLEGRRQFAARAQQALVGTGGVTSVMAEGSEERTLAVEGEVPAARIVELFLRPPDLRQRLLARGFRDFIARGSDRTVRMEIATGRSPDGAAADTTALEGLTPEGGSGPGGDDS